MMLASCGTTLTRADAIEAMNKISTANATATKVTYKKEWKEANSTKKLGSITGIYDADNKYSHLINNYTDDGKEVKTEAWAYTKDSTFYVAVADGDKKQYAKVEDATALANTASTKVAAHLAKGVSSANKANKYGFCGFLAQFPAGSEVFADGTGSLNTAHIEGESYTSYGEGSLKCTYNAKYDGQEDEFYSAEWKENLLVSLSNAKKTSSSGYGFETWNWGSAATSTPDLSKFTEVTGILEKVAFIAIAEAILA